MADNATGRTEPVLHSPALAARRLWRAFARIVSVLLALLVIRAVFADAPSAEATGARGAPPRCDHRHLP